VEIFWNVISETSRTCRKRKEGLFHRKYNKFESNSNNKIVRDLEAKMNAWKVTNI
jgi:hypothetical protein